MERPAQIRRTKGTSSRRKSISPTGGRSLQRQTNVSETSGCLSDDAVYYESAHHGSVSRNYLDHKVAKT